MRGRMWAMLSAVLWAGTAFGGVAEMREGAFTVKPNPCAGCPMRMRFLPDGRTAFVNTSRVSESEFAAEARRAFGLMKKAAAAKGGALLSSGSWSDGALSALGIPEELVVSSALDGEHDGMTRYGLRCFLSTPLISDRETGGSSGEDCEPVTNSYLRMMCQNGFASRPRIVQREGKVCVLVKDADEAFGRARYLALCNAGDAARNFSVSFAELGLYGKVRAFDLGERADLEIQERTLELAVPAHSARFFRLDAEKREGL